MTGGGQWEPGARSSISSSVFAMRIAVVVVAVSSVLRPVVVVVVATFLVSMLCVCTCVCMCGCWSLSRQRLQNKNILCNSLKAIFRCSFCCWVFALFLWYLSSGLNRNLGRISLCQNWRAFDRAQLHLQLLLLEISNWKWKQDFFNNKFTHFRKFQKVGERERETATVLCET